jgi:hypothetical protein
VAVTTFSGAAILPQMSQRSRADRLTRPGRRRQDVRAFGELADLLDDDAAEKPAHRHVRQVGDALETACAFVSA